MREAREYQGIGDRRQRAGAAGATSWCCMPMKIAPIGHVAPARELVDALVGSYWREAAEGADDAAASDRGDSDRERA